MASVQGEGFAASGSALLVFGGIALALLSSALAALVLRRPLARLAPLRTPFRPSWGLPHVLIVVGTYIALLAVIGQLTARSDGSSPGGVGVLLYTVLVQGAVVLLIVAFARALHGDAARALGFASGDGARAAVFGAFVYALAVPALFTLLALWSVLLGAAGVEAPRQPIVELALGLDGVGLALFAFLAVVVVPLCEELIFRVFLQSLLVKHLGTTGGVVATAALFALVHGNLLASVPIFALALLLGFVMLRTQRTSASWVVHAAHNGLMLLLLFSAPQSRELLGS